MKSEYTRFYKDVDMFFSEEENIQQFINENFEEIFNESLDEIEKRAIAFAKSDDFVEFEHEEYSEAVCYIRDYMERKVCE